MSEQYMEKWTGKDYIGERYDNYYVAYSHHRDSDILEESNYQTMKKLFDDNKIVYIEPSSSHWLVGWVEMLLIREDNIRGIEYANELLNRIEDYPLLDDEDFSNREYEAIEESRRDWFISDFIHGVNNTLEIELTDNTDDDREKLLDLSRKMEDRTNEYWNIEGSGASIDIDPLIKAVTIEDLKKAGISFEEITS